MPLRGGTPCKIRVRAGGQPVVRLDAGDGRACAGPVASPALCRRVDRVYPGTCGKSASAGRMRAANELRDGVTP